MTDGADNDARGKLRDLGEWLIQLSEAKRGLSPEEGFQSAIPLPPSRHAKNGESDELMLSWFAREEYEERRRRNGYFDEGLFGEPTWDILLDLFSSQVIGRRISVSSACIASCVPQSTALRWLQVMIDRGLIERVPDPVDGRRAWLHLSEKTYLTIANYLAERAEQRTGIKISSIKAMRPIL